MIEILIGMISGIVSGTGMGGGTILIFLLTFMMGIEQHVSQATNLIFFIPTSIVAIIINIKNKNIDLVLSGHAHGGQFRLPFLGGVIAPNQGLFPKYDAGIYTENGTTMIVSRGIGNSIIPVRINNPPEIVIIELNLQR